jgi:hypothetical protein
VPVGRLCLVFLLLMRFERVGATVFSA